MSLICPRCGHVLTVGERRDEWCDRCGRSVQRFAETTKSVRSRFSARNWLSIPTTLLAFLLGLALFYFLVMAVMGDRESIAFVGKLSLRLAVILLVVIPFAVVGALTDRRHYDEWSKSRRSK